MDLYFKRHDGQAVTCDDFLAAMADANNQDLSSVARWSALHLSLAVSVLGAHHKSTHSIMVALKAWCLLQALGLRSFCSCLPRAHHERHQMVLAATVCRHAC